MMAGFSEVSRPKKTGISLHPEFEEDSFSNLFESRLRVDSVDSIELSSCSTSVSQSFLLSPCSSSDDNDREEFWKAVEILQTTPPSSNYSQNSKDNQVIKIPKKEEQFAKPQNDNTDLASNDMSTLLLSPSIEIKDIRGEIVASSKQQLGSRFIQKKMEQNPDVMDSILPEILPHCLELTRHLFGNYVIQKYFILGNDSHRNAILNEINGSFLILSLDIYGCRVIQAALDNCKEEERIKILMELRPNLLLCAKDLNGNHVIQKSIQTMPEPYLRLICDSFKGKYSSLSSHLYGCRVVQRALEYCPEDLMSSIIAEITTNTVPLCHDQYGNYVIQHVLEYDAVGKYKQIIVNQLKGKFTRLSQHKFASNVVERCLINGNAQQRYDVISEILALDSKENWNRALFDVLKHEFGNYVIQTMIDCADARLKTIIIEKLTPYLLSLQKYKTAKRILSKFSSYIPKYNEPTATNSSFSQPF